MKIRYKSHPFSFIFIGYLLSLCGCITMAVTFFIAYFNRHHVVVYINNYGEATIEFILIPFVLSIVIVGLIKTYKLLFYEVEVEE